jgi:lipoprotein-anchoring transpeptidase ErfK/SrfK
VRRGRELQSALMGLALLSGLVACARRTSRSNARADDLHAAPSASSASSASALGSANRVAAPTSSALGLPASSLDIPAKPRVYVKNRYVFVRPRPDVNTDWFGFLWFGASVELKSTEPTRGPGCASYYAIEPNGYVCVDGKQATLAADDPVFKAVSRYAPRLDLPAPHRYGESIGAELRGELPGAVSEFPGLPSLFHEPRRHLLPLSTVAYADERTILGQTWLLSADLLWVKKEQVTLYPEITFHGVELGRQYRLPLAFFRQSGSAKYRPNTAGKLERSAESFPLQSMVPLAMDVRIQRGERYFKSAEGDDWVRERDAVLPAPRSLTPWGARVGTEDRTGLAPKNARKSWIEVSVLGGWLLAYEGTQPVYATLISPGRGGIPQDGKDTLEIAATPTGTFAISGKLATVTMQAPGEYVHSDVPWTQNFQKPYAIHTAYWHNNWGNPQSGGCINVSPVDGKWLFEFSEPALPPGWHAVRWQPALGAPTLLVVHE